MKRLKETESALSFHGYLQMKVSNCVSGFQHSERVAELLSEFVIVLSHYQEEGIYLFPVIFLVESMEELLSVTQGSDPVWIGQGEQTHEYVRRVFKQCAPLVEGREWAIFVLLSSNSLDYGVFRTELSPLNPTPFERLRQTNDPRLNLIGLTRLGGGFVEVRNSHGNFQYLNMTGSPDAEVNPIGIIREFTRIIASDAPPEFTKQLKSFYYRLSVDILHANHGTLIAIVNSKNAGHVIFDDGVILKPPINILEGISKFTLNSSSDSFQQIFAWNQLIRRMTMMDGITVLDSAGGVVGYSCFIRNPSFECQGKSVMLGGARRRAFDVLCSHLGNRLLAVLYKSQDGLVELGTLSSQTSIKTTKIIKEHSPLPQ